MAELYNLSTVSVKGGNKEYKDYQPPLTGIECGLGNAHAWNTRLKQTLNKVGIELHVRPHPHDQ